VNPQDFSATRDQCGPRQLQHVAVLLERPFNADGTSGRFRCRATTAALGSRKQDPPPIGSFQTHRAVAFALGIRDADGLNPVAPAEARHFDGSSLHHAAHADAAFAEPRECLAQLREGLRIEGSAKMPEPQNQRGTLGPKLGEMMRLAGGTGVGEIRSGVADGWYGRHEGMPTFRPQLSYRRTGGCGLGTGRASLLGAGRPRPRWPASWPMPQAVADVGRAISAGR